MFFRKRALARIGRQNRRGKRFGKRQEFGGGVRVQHALSGPDNGVLRFPEKLGCAGHGDRIRRLRQERHRFVVQLSLVFMFPDFDGDFEQRRARLAGPHRMIGLAKQVRQFPDVVGASAPLGHGSEGFDGTESGMPVLTLEPRSGRQNEDGDVFRIGLGNPGESVLDSRAVLDGEHAIDPAAPDPRITVGDADPDPLLATQDRPDVPFRASLDHRVSGIARKEFRTFDLEDIGDDIGSVH